MNAIQVIRQRIELPQLLAQSLAPVRVSPQSNSSQTSLRQLKPLIRKPNQQTGQTWKNLLKGV
jgi:hypothetical protein